MWLLSRKNLETGRQRRPRGIPDVRVRVDAVFALEFGGLVGERRHAYASTGGLFAFRIVGGLMDHGG
jgi:hypothetical protein